MEVIQKEVSYPSTTTEYTLYPLGDIHAGTRHCAENHIKRTVAKIKEDPNALWVGMGDYAEFIKPKDKRWDGQVISDWLKPNNIAELETAWVVDLFQPIKEKCIGLIKGNHEFSIEREFADDVQYNICERLGVPNLGYSCFLKLVFCRQKSKEHHAVMCYLTHGAGCAITKGAKLTRLQRVMDSFEADLYAHAHVHDIITDSKEYLGINDAMRAVSKHKVGAMTGCYFRTYSQGVPASYGEQKGYPPTAIGSPTFTIGPSTGVLRVQG